MKPKRNSSDSRLATTLNDLLLEETLPPLDRWFSSRARSFQWTAADQKKLWDSLRRALVRGFSLLPPAAGSEASAWSGFRSALRGRAHDWALLAGSQSPSTLVGSGIAAWLHPSLEARWRISGWSAAQKKTFLSLQELPAPVHVRFRTGPEGEACRQRLLKTKVIAPSALAGFDCLTGGGGLEASPEWKSGLIEIQDAASQLSLAELGLRPGMRVWDLCAGRGGKTLLAAAELRGKGAIVATDVAEGKLKVLKDRVRRSGWQNIRLLEWDGIRVPDFGPENAGKGGFDRVIVDAPCSAAGTWRRDPEGRFRLTPQVLKELILTQKRLVKVGWDALKSGGRLAYITCSWLPEENEGVVDAFVASTEARVVHQKLLGLPDFDANTLFVSILEKPL